MLGLNLAYLMSKSWLSSSGEISK